MGSRSCRRAPGNSQPAGSLFGLVIAPSGNGFYYVDDGDSTLKLLH
jgi:hypothetical protein